LESNDNIFNKKNEKSISRKELIEVPLLLKEFETERYDLFSTGICTPDALKRCKIFDEKSIYIFDEDTIKQKLREHKEVANKYFSLHSISMNIMRKMEN